MQQRLSTVEELSCPTCMLLQPSSSKCIILQDLTSDITWWHVFLQILKILKSACILSASLPVSQPAIRPGCARCRAPEISHDKGNGGGFTKMLFRRRFTHYTMVFPFILLSPSLFFFIPLARCESHLRR